MSIRVPCLILVLALGSGGCRPPEQESGDFSVPVRTEPVRTEPIENQVRLVGSLRANEAVEIRPEISGILEEIRFEEGETVKAGDLVAVLNKQELSAQQAEARANLELAEANFQRVSQLHEQRTVASQDYDEARRSLSTARALALRIETLLEETQILAPFDGTLGERHVSPGQYVEPSTILVELVDADPVKAEFRVPERFLAALEIGKEVQVRVGAYPDRRFSGEVYFISPSVDPATRTVLLKARIPNEEALLKPGMFANLELVLSRSENAVVIPEEAITLISQEPAVFVVEDGKAAMRRVTLGVRVPGSVEVLEGLEPGEQLITAGLQKVRDGVPVLPRQQTAETDGGLPQPGKS